MARKLGADYVLEPANTDGTVYEHDPDLAKKIRNLTDGVGVDVALEMSGQNASVNNAIASVRRGGDVILFGLKSGDAVIEDLDRVIVDGISLHSVVGRRIFETWYITKNLLESREPNIHDLIWNVILEEGRGTVVDFKEFDRGRFEEGIKTHPKMLLRYA
jgi:threonine 3-dehydrogenase